MPGELFVERLRQFDDGSGASPRCLIEQTPPRSGFTRSERGARLLGADRAAGDHVDAVRDASDGRDVRLGHQNGNTSLVAQATERLEHSSNRRRSQELRGFVDEQQSRLAHEGNRERHESLLAATEDAGALLDAAAQLGKEREGCVGAGSTYRRGDASCSEPEVVAYREIGEHRTFGRDVPDRAVTRDVDDASLRCGESGDGAQRGRLAASVVPDERDDLTRAHVQVHVADHDPSTETCAQVLDAEDFVERVAARER